MSLLFLCLFCPLCSIMATAMLLRTRLNLHGLNHALQYPLLGSTSFSHTHGYHLSRRHNFHTSRLLLLFLPDISSSSSSSSSSLFSSPSLPLPSSCEKFAHHRVETIATMGVKAARKLMKELDQELLRHDDLYYNKQTPEI